MQEPRHSRALQVIAAFKFLKAFALIALGIGALKLLHKDISAELARWIDAFRVDPGNRYVQFVFGKLNLLDAHRLKELSIATFAYAALFVVEGTGLALGKRWAEYLTAIATASFLPLEIYELARRLTVPRAATLVVNLAILIYLIRDLRRARRLQTK